MGIVGDSVRLWLRDYNTEGVVSTGIHNPEKTNGIAFGLAVEDRLDAIQASQTSGSFFFETWTLLAAVAPTISGTRGEVSANDTGTHTDPVVGGTVPNAGQYRWSTSPAGWKRIDGNAFTALAADITALEAQDVVHSADIAALEADVAALNAGFANVSQIIGAPSTPAAGVDSPSNTLWVPASAVNVDGFISSFQIYASGTGDVRIRRLTKSGDVFTVVGGDVSLPIAAGLNSFTRADGTLKQLIEVKVGEYIGIYSRKAECLQYTGVNGTGHYSGAGDVYQFTDAVITTSQTLQVRIGIEQTSKNITNQKLADANTVISAGEQVIGVGSGLALDESGPAAAPVVFVFRNPVAGNGHIKKIDIGVKQPGRLYFKRFLKSGDNFTQTGQDIPLDVVTTGTVTLEGAALPYIEVEKDEYLGFYRGTALVGYLNSAAGIDNYANPFYAATATGNQSSFTDATADAVSIQMRFTVELGDVPRLDRRMDVLATQVQAVAPDAAFYEDTIVDASMTAIGLDATISVTLNREGAEQVLLDSQTFTAPSAGLIRYDLYYLDGQDLTFGAQLGTARATDHTSFLPVVTDPKRIPLFSVRVTPTSITAVPVWKLLHGVDRSIANQLDLDRQQSRRNLPKLISRIARGQTIRIVGFGDSITSIRSSTEPVGYLTSPNGEFRDRAAAVGTLDEYLATKYGTDVLSTLPLFTAVQLGRADDGAGAVHTKVGWNWKLVEGLQAARGYTLGTDLFYDNFGRGGYSSVHAVVGGVAQPWLTSAAGIGAHVAIVALGMNERGDPDTEDRLKVVAETFKAAGTEVVFMGVPRPVGGSLSDWQFTNRVIRRVAMLTGSAHVSTAALTDDRYLQAMGIAAADMAAANANNHPGLREFDIYGLELNRLILG